MQQEIVENQEQEITQEEEQINEPGKFYHHYRPLSNFRIFFRYFTRILFIFFI